MSFRELVKWEQECGWKIKKIVGCVWQPTWLHCGQIVPYKCNDLLWWIEGLVDQWRAAHVIYLDFCNAFDTIPQDVLVSKLDSYVFDRWITLLDKELAGCLHSKGCGQELQIQEEVSDNLHSLGVGTGTVNHLCQWLYDSRTIPLRKSGECKERTWLKVTKA